MERQPSMPQNVFGLPTHIVLLHIVVVLVPIAAATAVATVMSSWFRHHFSLTVLAGTFLVTIIVLLTSQAGEALAHRLPDSQEIRDHADIGKQLVIWAAVFGVCLAAVVVLDLIRRAPASDLTRSESWAVRLVPAVWGHVTPSWINFAFRVAQLSTVLTSLAVVAVVIIAGHTGAQAVWSDYPNMKPG
jgi:Predicted membrane protein (DUF2231)